MIDTDKYYDSAIENDIKYYINNGELSLNDNLKFLIDSVIIDTKSGDFLLNKILSINNNQLISFTSKIFVLCKYIMNNKNFKKLESAIVNHHRVIHYSNLFIYCVNNNMQVSNQQLNRIRSMIGSNLSWEQQLSYYALYLFLLNKLNISTLKEYEVEYGKLLNESQAFNKIFELMEYKK